MGPAYKLLSMAMVAEAGKPSPSKSYTEFEWPPCKGKVGKVGWWLDRGPECEVTVWCQVDLQERESHTHQHTNMGFCVIKPRQVGKDEVIFPILKKWHFKGTLIVSVWLSVIPELGDVRTTQGIVKTIRLTHSSLKGLWSYQCIKCEVRQWGRSKRRAQNYFRCNLWKNFFVSFGGTVVFTDQNIPGLIYRLQCQTSWEIGLLIKLLFARKDGKMQWVTENLLRSQTDLCVESLALSLSL